MNRDGVMKSLWQLGTYTYTPANPWEKDEVYDVLIVGAGITGLTTALLLQEKGLRCIVAEAHNIGFGTTGGTTAHLNTLLDTSYEKIERNFDKESARLVAIGAREAIDLVEGLINKFHIDCDFSYKSGYLYAETKDEADELIKIKEGNDRVGVISSWSDVIPVPIPFKKAIKVDFQAQLHSLKYINGLAKAYEAYGGVILQHCLVHKVAGDPVTADASLGAIKAKRVIYATHIPPGINIFSFRCAPYRSYAMAFTLNSGHYPDALAYDSQDPYHYFRAHNISGQEYVIAGGCDHKTGHVTNTEHVFTELEAYVRSYFDIDTIVSKWSSQYYEPVDGLPYIGLMPGHENVYVATGFSGCGMTLGSLAAKTLCSIISGEVTPYSELFDPGRIKMIAGFTNFVKENADVVSRFVSGRINMEWVKQLADIAPGEAVIAEWDGSKVALYKNEQGHFYALDPVCKHAKCLVQWNNAEKTWDCPCHGARYAPNGDLLNGPAQHGLTQLKWEDIQGD